MLFLFAVCLLAIAKLVRLWWAAPPFRLERQERNSAYFRTLETSSSSLRQWITCTFLAWGIVASVVLYDFCNRLLGQKAVGRIEILLAIEGFSTVLSIALLVVFFLVLIRWHILKRIEQLRHVNQNLPARPTPVWSGYRTSSAYKPSAEACHPTYDCAKELTHAAPRFNHWRSWNPQGNSGRIRFAEHYRRCILHKFWRSRDIR
jgi:hypothetical protein